MPLLLSSLEQTNDTLSYMGSTWGHVSLHHAQSKMFAIQHPRQAIQQLSDCVTCKFQGSMRREIFNLQL